MRYVLTLLLTACGPRDGLEEARPPELGKADSGDAPDNACKVVLREMNGLDDVTVAVKPGTGSRFEVIRDGGKVDVAVEVGRRPPAGSPRQR